MEIELASPEEIASVIQHLDQEPSTISGKNWNKEWKHTKARNQELKKIETEFRRSEEKRKTLTRAQKRQEEEERWDRIFKERIEDKEYYLFTGLPLRREHSSLKGTGLRDVYGRRVLG